LIELRTDRVYEFQGLQALCQGAGKRRMTRQEFLPVRALSGLQGSLVLPDSLNQAWIVRILGQSSSQWLAAGSWLLPADP
jgi:hypothetical protein